MTEKMSLVTVCDSPQLKRYSVTQPEPEFSGSGFGFVPVPLDKGNGGSGNEIEGGLDYENC